MAGVEIAGGGFAPKLNIIAGILITNVQAPASNSNLAVAHRYTTASQRSAEYYHANSTLLLLHVILYVDQRSPQKVRTSEFAPHHSNFPAAGPATTATQVPHRR